MSGPDTYQLGNALFVNLRAFLSAAGVDPSECRVIVELPTSAARSQIVDSLVHSSPPIGTFSRASAAQAGNYGGKWQGVAYDFTVKEIPNHDPT